jgi:hypothetical protein
MAAARASSRIRVCRSADEPNATAILTAFEVRVRCFSIREQGSDSIFLICPRRAMPHFSKLDCTAYPDLHDCSRQYRFRGYDAEAILRGVHNLNRLTIQGQGTEFLENGMISGTETWLRSFVLLL